MVVLGILCREISLKTLNSLNSHLRHLPPGSFFIKDERPPGVVPKPVLSTLLFFTLIFYTICFTFPPCFESCTAHLFDFFDVFYCFFGVFYCFFVPQVDGVATLSHDLSCLSHDMSRHMCVCPHWTRNHRQSQSHSHTMANHNHTHTPSPVTITLTHAEESPSHPHTMRSDDETVASCVTPTSSYAVTPTSSYATLRHLPAAGCLWHLRSSSWGTSQMPRLLPDLHTIHHTPLKCKRQRRRRQRMQEKSVEVEDARVYDRLRPLVLLTSLRPDPCLRVRRDLCVVGGFMVRLVES